MPSRYGLASLFFYCPFPLGFSASRSAYPRPW
jgi:hypothetical protein